MIVDDISLISCDVKFTEKLPSLLTREDVSQYEQSTFYCVSSRNRDWPHCSHICRLKRDAVILSLSRHGSSW